MLTRGQLRSWVDRLGVPETQIRRDHLISHLLHRLSELAPEVRFFGGTALCRTHLLDWRLSEDLDLLVQRVTPTAQLLDRAIPEALRREFPGLAIAWGREGEAEVGTVNAGQITVRVQLVALDHSYRQYPTAPTPVALRYDDLPQSVSLVCPTPAGAAAMKLNAWSSRKAPRDLCDLYGLAQAGWLSSQALEIAAQAARAVQRDDFDDSQLPTREQWVAALGHQMRHPPARDVALASVRETLARAQGA